MKQLLFFMITLSVASLVKAQTPAGAPPLRTTDPTLVRPKPAAPLPLKTGTAPTAAATAAMTTGTITATGGTSAASTSKTVPVRTTDAVSSGRTSKETPTVKPGGNPQTAGNRPLLPSDSAVLRKKTGAN